MAKPSSLVIVESPSKAKTIGKYLGPEYTVKASMGHLRDLPKSKMGVDFENGFTFPVRVGCQIYGIGGHGCLPQFVN